MTKTELIEEIAGLESRIKKIEASNPAKAGMLGAQKDDLEHELEILESKTIQASDNTVIFLQTPGEFRVFC